MFMRRVARAPSVHKQSGAVRMNETERYSAPTACHVVNQLLMMFKNIHTYCAAMCAPDTVATILLSTSSSSSHLISNASDNVLKFYDLCVCVCVCFIFCVVFVLMFMSFTQHIHKKYSVLLVGHLFIVICCALNKKVYDEVRLHQAQPSTQHMQTAIET